jgi:hypothetical protein
MSVVLCLVLFDQLARNISIMKQSVRNYHYVRLYQYFDIARDSVLSSRYSTPYTVMKRNVAARYSAYLNLLRFALLNFLLFFFLLLVLRCLSCSFVDDDQMSSSTLQCSSLYP